jgi:hypothetical protein
MAFDNRVVDGDFTGSIINPIRIIVDDGTGDLSLASRTAS